MVRTLGNGNSPSYIAGGSLTAASILKKNLAIVNEVKQAQILATSGCPPWRHPPKGSWEVMVEATLEALFELAEWEMQRCPSEAE